MKARKISKVASIFIVVSGVLLLSVAGIPAMADEGGVGSNPIIGAYERPVQNDDTPGYVPDQIIVKFRQGAAPEITLRDCSVGYESVRRIHERAIAAEIARLRNTLKEEGLKKDSDSWFWFRGKEYDGVDSIEDEVLFEELYKDLRPTRQAMYRKYLIVLAGISVEEAVEALRDCEDVESVMPNLIETFDAIPNDTLFNLQWALHNTGQEIVINEDLSFRGTADCDIDAPEAWDITRGDAAITIAVIDSGVHYQHPDLAGNIWINSAELSGNGLDDDLNGYIDDICGWDFANGDGDPDDINGHGTACAGIIAAAGNNGMGVSGVAPLCSIMPLRTSLESAQIALAINYAIGEEADIISMSFGGYGQSRSYEDELRDAYAAGIVLVASAGNDGRSDRRLPSAMDEVISVAATDYNNEHAIWNDTQLSNFGHTVDVAAPGTHTVTLNNNNGYVAFGGTSAACPYVSGLAALLLSRNPGLTPEEVMAVIKASASGVPDSIEYIGQGVINALDALNIDPPPSATAKITGPNYGSSISRGTVVPVRGSSTGTGYEVSHCTKGPYFDGPWTAIGSGTSQVINGTLAQFDTAVLSSGTYFIKLVTTDTNGYVITDMTRIRISNQPPMFDPLIGNKEVLEGQLLAFAIRATDPNGDSLTFSISGRPSGASFVNNPGDTATFTWTPAVGQAGNYNVTFTVTDGEISFSTVPPVTITVTERNLRPRVGEVTVTEAQSNKYIFSARGTDVNGGDDIEGMHLHAVDSSGNHRFGLHYIVSTGLLRLKNDDNSGWIVTPDSDGLLKNSRVSINPADVTATVQAEESQMTINFPVKILGGIPADTYTMSVFVYDREVLVSGWQDGGIWEFRNLRPRAGGVTVTEVQSNKYIFSVSGIDINGGDDVEHIHLAIGPTNAPSDRLLWAYYKFSTNTLKLRNDTNGAWVKGPLTNSRVSINPAEVTTTIESNRGTVHLPVEILGAFPAGTYNMYILVADRAILTRGWQDGGAWEFRNLRPRAGGVTVTEAQSNKYIFSVSGIDINGGDDVEHIHLAIGPTNATPDRLLWAYYKFSTNTVKLRNDTNGAWINGSLTNSRVSINPAEITTTIESNRGTVHLPVEILDAFPAGTYNMYILVADKAGLKRGWQDGGAWEFIR